MWIRVRNRTAPIHARDLISSESIRTFCLDSCAEFLITWVRNGVWEIKHRGAFLVVREQPLGARITLRIRPMTSINEARTDHILRLPDVQRVTGLSRSSIYAMQASKQFPHSIQLSPRAVGWLESEIVAWLSLRISERGSAAADTSGAGAKLRARRSNNLDTCSRVARSPSVAPNEAAMNLGVHLGVSAVRRAR